MTYEKLHNHALVTVCFFLCNLIVDEKDRTYYIAELFYGPTYHIKDFSMQFIGQFLKYLVHKDEENDRV